MLNVVTKICYKLFTEIIFKWNFLPIALEARPSSASDDLNLLRGRGVLDVGRGVLDDPDDCCGVLGGLDVGRGDLSYLDVGRGDLLCFDNGLGVTSSSDWFAFWLDCKGNSGNVVSLNQVSTRLKDLYKIKDIKFTMQQINWSRQITLIFILSNNLVYFCVLHIYS